MAGMASFVLETATNPGTGSFTLNGAAADRVSFASAFSSGQQVYYFADDGTQAEWGIGTLTIGSPNTLARSVILKTTAGGTAALKFSGTVNVYNEVPGEHIKTQTSVGVASANHGNATNIGSSSAIVGQFTFTALGAQAHVCVHAQVDFDSANYTAGAGETVGLTFTAGLQVNGGSSGTITSANDHATIVKGANGKVVVTMTATGLTPGVTYQVFYTAQTDSNANAKVLLSWFNSSLVQF